MPIVFENPNADEAIARIVFDRDLFTIYYRRLTCGSGAMEGKDFLDIIKTEVSELENYDPVIVEMHIEPRHRHFKPRDTELSHMHLGFNQSIEKLKSIKLLVRVIDGLQANFKELWEKIKVISDKKFDQSICATVLFSNQAELLEPTENLFKKNKSYLASRLTCFWVKPNEPIQQIQCALLPDNIPTYLTIYITMQAIMLAPTAQQIGDNIDTEEISTIKNSRQAIYLTLLLGLLLSAILAVPLARRVHGMF